jgi:hypothetical protein
MPEGPPPERSLFAIGEIRSTREIDYEIETCLTHNTPQSMLRDLHRPETKWGITEYDYDRHEIPRDGGRGAVADIKTLVYQSNRIPICDLMRIPQLWQEAWGEFRAVMEGPWENTPKRGVQYLTRWLGRW